MTTIWKQVLESTDRQMIDIPGGAELLSAREQHDQICIWFRCDPNAPKALREIAIVGTGHDAPPFGNTWRFLGTASLYSGNLMFHVFEKITP